MGLQRVHFCTGEAQGSLSLCLWDYDRLWRGDQGREVNPQNCANCPGDPLCFSGATWHIALGYKPRHSSCVARGMSGTSLEKKFQTS